MNSTGPTVLKASNAEELMQHVLNHHAPPSTLIVCSSKAAFLEALQKSHQFAGPEDAGQAQSAPSSGTGQFLERPTLRLLSTSRTLKLAFCPDITHLRAYLATYSSTISKRLAESKGDTALRLPGATPILAILNPVELHRPTSAFSAQGLNRTLSVAVEAAHSTGSKLILCETPTSDRDPWDEELSILNVTTKRLGEMSVGRTVKAKTVAQRWCTFDRVSSHEAF
ncbi:Hypothetical predicted protein [Lecanosticta acicola]|uniref:Uncharacterized protein n=1 Tax=Lecanosticta acicola TaxID=111012 RepID=A0AAI8Z2U1_9PEZI|nr:Hypothetical predicted protein [Lecanosticta acicola]